MTRIGLGVGAAVQSSMRRGAGAWRMVVSLVGAALVLGGCSCNERIYVTNDTNEMLHVQVQLPKPELPWACGCKCVYETLVGPGATWSAARPGSPDQMDYPPEPYSPCGVVRARAGASGSWTRFTMCGPLVKNSNGDPVVLHILAGGPAGYSASAATQSGKTVEVSVDQVDH